MKAAWLPLRWSRTGQTRGRLILLAFLASLPITAMAVTIVWQDYQAITSASQERAALLDGQALAQFNAAVAAVTGRLSALGPQMTAESCQPVGGAVTALDGAATLLSLSIDGALLCRVGAPFDARPPLPWFERVRGGAPIAIGMTGQPPLPVVAIRGPDGSVTAAILQPEWLQDALPMPIDDSAATWLLDADGRVLASRGNSQAAMPRPAAQAGLEAAAQTVLRATSAAGRPYAYASTLLPTGWRVLAATSSQREHALGRQELVIRLLEMTVLLVAGLAAVVLAADMAFGKPLRQLSQAVQRWQAGAAFVPGNLVGAPDEVLDLARSFEEATGVLRDKEAQLARAETQQNLLLLEIHHRVKNNLQVVASLLNLQASRIRVPEARKEFQAARDRVRALATLHRHLYADGSLHTINMRSFLTELCGQLFQAMGEQEGDRIQLTIEAPELRMSSDQAVPLALIVTEAVTNSVKYAFPAGRTGHVSVTLTVPADDPAALDLVISDDGVGIPAGRQVTEAGMRDGIGLQLIRGFARQLGASLDVQQGNGTRYAVRMSPHAPTPPDRVPPLDGAEPERDTAA